MTTPEMILLCSSMQGDPFLCVWFQVLPLFQLLEKLVTPPPPA